MTPEEIMIEEFYYTLLPMHSIKILELDLHKRTLEEAVQLSVLFMVKFKDQFQYLTNSRFPGKSIRFFKLIPGKGLHSELDPVLKTKLPIMFKTDLRFQRVIEHCFIDRHNQGILVVALRN
jgi:hypothetical protein